ncbi:MAG: peptide methionine sulfoxide reductase [Maribacter sp.]
MKNPILKNIEKIPEGYSEGMYSNRKYGITKTLFNGGNSLKVYGEELGGTNFISLNYYITKKKDLIKPCEMPEQKVVHFLKNVVVLNTVNQEYKSDNSTKHGQL